MLSCQVVEQSGYGLGSEDSYGHDQAFETGGGAHLNGGEGYFDVAYVVKKYKFAFVQWVLICRHEVGAVEIKR